MELFNIYNLTATLGSFYQFLDVVLKYTICKSFQILKIHRDPASYVLKTLFALVTSRVNVTFVEFQWNINKSLLKKDTMLENYVFFVKFMRYLWCEMPIPVMVNACHHIGYNSTKKHDFFPLQWYFPLTYLRQSNYHLQLSLWKHMMKINSEIKYVS